MKIELSVSQLKEIYGVCGAALDPKNEKEPLRYIHLEAKNGVLHAFASDGYAAVETKTQVQEKEHFVCLLPVVQIPKSAEQVSIQILNGMMDISFSNGVKYTQRAVPPGLYMDVSLVNRSFERDQQKYEIAVNPKLLMRALKGFCDKKEAVDPAVWGLRKSLSLLTPLFLVEDRRSKRLTKECFCFLSD